MTIRICLVSSCSKVASVASVFTFGLRAEIPCGDHLIVVCSYCFLPIRNHYLIHKQNKYFIVKRRFGYLAGRKSQFSVNILFICTETST